MKKFLLVTFDYELYLGNRSGSVKDCMLEPTDKLIQIMEKYGIRSVFFVDTTYLLRLKEQAKYTPECQEDFERISAQLISLVAKGHYVFPHIHPHWLDAEYVSEKNQWKLNDIRKYRFHNISQDERDLVFDGSVEVLKDILHPSFPGYEINGYRAGGWGIQPFEDFQPYFLKHKIKYEFSVLGGFYQFADAQYFDFSTAPVKSVYRFSTDVCIEDTSGPFIQYNISSINIPPLTAFLNKLWVKLLYKVFNDHTFRRGEGQPSRDLKGLNPVNSSGKDISNSSWERISIELLTRVKLRLYNRYWKSYNYMHFISHPKMISEHNLSIFNKFLQKAFGNYVVETDFKKMISG